MFFRLGKAAITDPDALCGASITARRILQYGRPPDLFHRTMPVVLFGRPIEQRCRYLSDSDVNQRRQPFFFRHLLILLIYRPLQKSLSVRNHDNYAGSGDVHRLPRVAPLQHLRKLQHKGILKTWRVDRKVTAQLGDITHRPTDNFSPSDDVRWDSQFMYTPLYTLK